MAGFSLLQDFTSIGNQLAEAAKNVIITTVDFLTPLIDAICAGMVVIGLILATGLRQEYYGARLVIGGGVGLLVMHVVISVLLSLFRASADALDIPPFLLFLLNL